MIRNFFAHYPNPDLDETLESPQPAQDGSTQTLAPQHDISTDQPTNDAQRARLVATVQAMRELCP